MAKLPFSIVRLNPYSLIPSKSLYPYNNLFNIQQYLFSLEGFKSNNLSIAYSVV